MTDDGEVYGLAEDYKLSGEKGRDSFENWLTQTLLKDFGKDAGGLIANAFFELKPSEPDRLGSGDVCVVTVKPSGKPRFVVEDGKEVFYIRTGNATNALKMSEMLDYCKQRWPEAFVAGEAKGFDRHGHSERRNGAPLVIRVPWHDTGWDGHVCAAPRVIGSCLKLIRMAEKRDDEPKTPSRVNGSPSYRPWSGVRPELLRLLRPPRS